MAAACCCTWTYRRQSGTTSPVVAVAEKAVQQRHSLHTGHKYHVYCQCERRSCSQLGCWFPVLPEWKAGWCQAVQPASVEFDLPTGVEPPVHGHLRSGIISQWRRQLESLRLAIFLPARLLLLLVSFGERAGTSRAVPAFLLAPHVGKHYAVRGCDYSKACLRPTSPLSGCDVLLQGELSNGYKEYLKIDRASPNQMSGQPYATSSERMRGL